jgi:L,D-transpeptidase catalytic domain
MKERFPGQKLTLQDRYTGQRYVQRQYPTYAHQRERSVDAALYPEAPYYQPQRVSGRRKSRFIALLAFLVSISIIGFLGGYYMLMSGSQDARSQKLASFINIPGQGTESPSNLAALKGVAQARIDQLAADVDKIKRTGGDVTVDMQKLEQDRAKLSAVASSKDGVALLIQIGSNLTALQGDLAGNNASTLLSNFQQEAQQWGDAHKYHDAYDGKGYYLNSSYLNMDGHNGIQYGEGAYMSEEVNDGNPQASQDIKDDYFLLSMLEANYEDKTPYNQPHQVDQALLNYFGDQHTRVLIVSLTEQALRIYNNGQLEQSFQVTTGREYRPTPVGHFQLTQHFYNYTLTSYDPPSSPDYYPPVVVQNAIQFWNNGYLIHSSSWRKDYGPFTQFPHRDSGGDPQASVGSHGCINVPPDILSKLDPTITYQTPLIIF